MATTQATTRRLAASACVFMFVSALAGCERDRFLEQEREFYRLIERGDTDSLEDAVVVAVYESAIVAKETRFMVRYFSHVAYPMWRRANPEKTCPADIHELGRVVNAGAERTYSRKTYDPWGTDYKIACGPSAAAKANGFGVISAGPDRTLGTEDDFESGERYTLEERAAKGRR